jgi:hypothetical protein
MVKLIIAFRNFAELKHAHTHTMLEIIYSSHFSFFLSFFLFFLLFFLSLFFAFFFSFFLSFFSLSFFLSFFLLFFLSFFLLFSFFIFSFFLSFLSFFLSLDLCLPTHCRCWGLLLHLITHSDTYTHPLDSSGRGIGPLQRPIPDNTQHSQQRHLRLRQDSNSESQQASGRKPTP